jgi:hypothetical protein
MTNKQSSPPTSSPPNPYSPPDTQIIYFTANPVVVQPGGEVMLAWGTMGAMRCTIKPLEDSMCQGSPFSPPKPPPDSLPPSGQLEVCPPETMVYTLSAYGQGGNDVHAQVAVIVKSSSPPRP